MPDSRSKHNRFSLFLSLPWVRPMYRFKELRLWVQKTNFCAKQVRPSFLPSFLPSCLPAFLPSCLPAFLPSCLPAFLPSCLPACLPAFLPSCLPAFLPSLLPCFLASLLPCFLGLACLLPSFPPSFPPSLLPSFLLCIYIAEKESLRKEKTHLKRMRLRQTCLHAADGYHQINVTSM